MEEKATRIGTRLQSLREDKELTQEQAASELPIDVSTLGQIERGEIVTPSLEVIEALARLYGVTIESLQDLLNDDLSQRETVSPNRAYTEKSVIEAKQQLQDGHKGLKIIGEDEDHFYVAGYPIIWNSRDLAGHAFGKNADGSLGEFFTPETDLKSTFMDSGVLYVDWEHGHAKAPEPSGKNDVLGFIKTKNMQKDDYGLFAIQAISRHNEYADDTKMLIESGIVGNSTEAVKGMAQKKENGEIVRWGLKRNTLTVAAMDVEQHPHLIPRLKSIGYELPQTEEAEAEAGGTPAPTVESAGNEDQKPLSNDKEIEPMSDQTMVSRQELDEFKGQMLGELKSVLKEALPATNDVGNAEAPTQEFKSLGDDFNISLASDPVKARNTAMRDLAKSMTSELIVDQQTSHFDQFNHMQKAAFGRLLRVGGDGARLRDEDRRLLMQKAFSSFDYKLMLDAGMTVGEIKSAQQATVGSLGGWAIPPSVQDGIIEEQGKLTPIHTLVTMIDLTGDSTHVVRLDKRPAVFWGDECFKPNTSGMTLDTIEIKAHSVSTIICVTRKLLESVNIVPLIQRQITEALSESKEGQYLMGNGVSGPFGVLPGGKNKWGIQLVPSGDVDSLTTQGIINLTGALRQPYRANARMYANRKTTTQIWNLTSPSGDYIWGPAACCKGDDPGIIEAECLPDVAANSTPIIYGDWSGYYAVRKPGMTIEQFHDAATGAGLYQFQLWAFEGGAPIEMWKFAAQKVKEA